MLIIEKLVFSQDLTHRALGTDNISNNSRSWILKAEKRKCFNLLKLIFANKMGQKMNSLNSNLITKSML